VGALGEGPHGSGQPRGTPRERSGRSRSGRGTTPSRERPKRAGKTVTPPPRKPLYGVGPPGVRWRLGGRRVNASARAPPDRPDDPVGLGVPGGRSGGEGDCAGVGVA